MNEMGYLMETALHNKDGIRRALDLYDEMMSEYDHRKRLTQLMYGLLNEALVEVEFNEMERRVIEHRYVNPKGSEAPLAACAEYLSVSNRVVAYHSLGVLEKVYEYMEQEGSDYYAQHYYRFQN